MEGNKSLAISTQENGQFISTLFSASMNERDYSEVTRGKYITFMYLPPYNPT